MGWSPDVWKGAVDCPTCRQLIKEPAILSVFSWKQVRSVCLPTLPCKTQSFTSLANLLLSLGNSPVVWMFCCVLRRTHFCTLFLPGTSSSLWCGFFFIAVKKYLLTSATTSRQKVVCFTLKESVLFDSALLAKKYLLPKGTNLSNC